VCAQSSQRGAHLVGELLLLAQCRLVLIAQGAQRAQQLGVLPLQLRHVTERDEMSRYHARRRVGRAAAAARVAARRRGGGREAEAGRADGGRGGEPGRADGQGGARRRAADRGLALLLEQDRLQLLAQISHLEIERLHLRVACVEHPLQRRGALGGGLAGVHGGGELGAGLLVLVAQRVQRLLLCEDAWHLAVDLKEHLAERRLRGGLLLTCRARLLLRALVLRIEPALPARLARRRRLVRCGRGRAQREHAARSGGGGRGGGLEQRRGRWGGSMRRGGGLRRGARLRQRGV